MSKKSLIITIVLVIIGIAIAVFTINPQILRAPSEGAVATPASIPDLIIVDYPLPKTKISSPYTVSGKARGAWYFEASAPYELQDANGNMLAQGHITAQGDWMTESFVPFSAIITFTKPSTPTGILILKNDNPSGDPTKEKRLEIPVTF